ncbi:MAG: glycosyl transferase [Schumannella sp.]|nr:glycosyl transferase [Schumannella sp.]
MLAPVAWRTPPRHYGPWERVTSLLTEGLVGRGVDVTLFATGDSVTAATLDWVVPRGYADDDTVDGRISEAIHVGHALERSGDFDLVHNHLDWLPLAMAGGWRAPMVTTIHGFSGPKILPAYRAGRSAYVSISDADRSPQLDYIATIHHGIDMAEFAPRAVSDDSLVVFGRIHPDKGTAEAIAIARRSGRPLTICGPIHDAEYFAAQVEPELGPDVQYLGSVEPHERSRILGNAAVLLHPIAFPEPFGLSVIEAMACGTPVVAYRRGSMAEVIDDGVTGFAVADQDAAVAAVAIAATLDRAVVRETAERRFGVDRMVTEYLAVYDRILQRPPMQSA